jgi:VanZ family protein
VVPQSSGMKLNDQLKFEIRLDYFLHFMAYVSLPVIYLLSCQRKENTPVRYGIAIVVLLLVFAVSTESIQLLLTFRTFNINDMLANVLGILFGFIINYFLLLLWPNQNNS